MAHFTLVRDYAWNPIIENIREAILSQTDMSIAMLRKVLSLMAGIAGVIL